jgi:hypothetical protein
MSFPATMAFDHLGALILRHPPLHLEQQIIFRAAAQLAVEAHYLDAHPLECIHE